MIPREALKPLSPVLWEIPRSHRADMRVPARVLTSESLLDEVLDDRSLEQLVNVATLPGIQVAALAMPDVHEGYGFPIGGVAAMAEADGVISPGGIGYDINCGVRLLLSQRTRRELGENLAALAHELSRAVPSGMGRGGHLSLPDEELDVVLRQGIDWAVRRGYASPDDARRIESGGRLPEADPAAVSRHAKDRGRDQLGTMGSGNHFVEVDVVESLGDSALAERFGLFPDQVVFQIHCGSRGLGHQVCSDHVRAMVRTMPGYGIEIPDRELACAPFASPEGASYFGAMAAAANFAWVNRQLITAAIRDTFRRILGPSAGPLPLLYDVAHNIAKREAHEIDGRARPLVVHRKGATRAFGPGHPDLPEEFRATGQPVLIPGSMGTASHVLAGTTEGMRVSFGSSCHGAGRRMSRHAAKRQQSGSSLRQEMRDMGIVVKVASVSGLSEEAAYAYKDVEQVVDVIERAGIGRKVARLAPLAVVKG
jgi:tRNA-splicing ligase RtcB